MRIIILFLLLSGCANSLIEVRESPPEQFTAEGTIESVSRCILDDLESTAPSYYKKLTLGMVVPPTYEIRQYSEQWEIISKMGESTGFLVIVEGGNTGVNILPHPGLGGEIQRARSAINTCQ